MRLAYVCHIFPHLTQTFVYREVEELRRAGIPLTVFSMKRPEVATLSAESRHLMADTVYLPRVISLPVLASQVIWLLRAPRRYLQALTLVARGRYRFNNGPSLWLHGIIDFARGAHLARLVAGSAGVPARFGMRAGRGDRSDSDDGAVRARGTSDPPSLRGVPGGGRAPGALPEFAHLHAQFADDACTTTLVASLLTGISFSFRSHTSPNPQLIDEKVRRAQFVVSASLYDQRVLVHWCGEGAADKIHVNRLGVPLDQYRPGSGSWELGVRVRRVFPQLPTPNSQPLVLSVGTLCGKKGFEYVIRACRVLANREVDFRCVIVGDGPDRAKLEALITALGLHDRVTLAPYMPQEELRELFREASIFTLPCIFPLDGNVDVIPLVLQEAMAMGCPVASTPISGIPELIQDGLNGLLVPEKDHEALAEALARLLEDPDLACRLGTAARETVTRYFDVAANAAELAGILRREVSELGVEVQDSPELAAGFGLRRGDCR
jgi:glycosyltransferase involved in cell wall biosynthesis